MPRDPRARHHDHADTPFRAPLALATASALLAAAVPAARTAVDDTDGTRAASRRVSPARCTTLIVGRDATADGSVILGHNEDLDEEVAQHVVAVPAQDHGAGETVALIGVEIPQVEHTYAYTATRIFDRDYIPGDVTSGINEHQLMVTNNLAYQRDSSWSPIPGRILWSEFTYLALERAATAREAVQVVGDLAQTYRLGMDTGTMVAVADPDEGWFIEIASEGQWVAERVDDDEVEARANTWRIGVVDFDDPDRFLYSPDLVDHATAMGWYAGGAFDFAAVYGDPVVAQATWNTHRTDRIADLLGSAAGSIVPGDVTAVLRDHYEGTPWDLTDGYTTGTPHDTAEYCPCAPSTVLSSVCQARGSLPWAVGGVCWRALASPCTGVYVPWYAGHPSVPAPYETGTASQHADSAFWAFRDINAAADARYAEVIDDLRGYWGGLEAEWTTAQADEEQHAAELFETDPDAATAYLGELTNERATRAFEDALTLLDNDLDVGALGDDDDSAGGDDDDAGDDDAGDDDATADDDATPPGDDDAPDGCRCAAAAGARRAALPSAAGLAAPLLLAWISSRRRGRSR